MSQQQIVIPVLGMTCANCVSTLERASGRVDGVDEAVFNLANERGMITYDPEKASVKEIVSKIERYGYKVPTGQTIIGIPKRNQQSFEVWTSELEELDGVVGVEQIFRSCGSCQRSNRSEKKCGRGEKLG